MPMPLNGSALGRTVFPSIAVLVACGMTACLITGYSPYEVYEKVKRWLARQQVPRDALEPNQDPWPAGGFPGPPKSRPLTTIAQLLTWTPPTAGDITNSSLEGEHHGALQQQHATGQGVAAAGSTVLQSTRATQGQLPDPCSSNTPLVLPQPGIRGAGSAGTSHGAADCPAGRPQLLVCHDMMGGYHPQETLLSGADDHRHYRLWHWDCVDIFVYFSHHLVTVPPKSWIHAAHKHGVKVLGTFITEFGQGRHRCNKLFSSNQSAEVVADQLVAVAAHYGFEGWLVNIENSLSKEQVEILKHFVGYLRARMAAVVQHGMVVWYDAVTTAGELRWQNKLSPPNAPFFDLADALFVNYTWTPATLPETVTAAGGRVTDVFMGIDVYGRGSYGGGGHNVDVALRAVADAGLSAALFAPGWVFENLDRTQFVRLQEQWWNKVQATWCHNHPVLISLPFTTCFNSGAGRGWFQNGRLVAQGTAASQSSPPLLQQQQQQKQHDSSRNTGNAANGYGWFNMLLTDTLPTCRDPITQQVVSGPVVGRLSSSTAFNGGSCLVLCKQTSAKVPATPASADEDAVGPIVDVQAATAASGPAAVIDKQCCLLQLADSATVEAGQSEPSSNSRKLASLQLYKADVLVPSNGVLSVSWVYGAPEMQSSTGAGSSGKSSAIAAIAAAAGTASHAELYSTESFPSDLLLWVMLEQSDAVDNSPGITATVTPSVVAPKQPTMHLLGCRSVSKHKQKQQQPQLQLAGADHGRQAVMPAVQVVEMVTSQSLGPIQFARNICDVGSNSSNTAGSGVQSTAALCVDGMWDNDLSSVLAGWEWRRCTAKLSVTAGSVVAGWGVAVALGEVAAGAGVSFGAESTRERSDVLSVLGEMQLTML